VSTPCPTTVTTGPCSLRARIAACQEDGTHSSSTRCSTDGQRRTQQLARRLMMGNADPEVTNVCCRETSPQSGVEATFQCLKINSIKWKWHLAGNVGTQARKMLGTILVKAKQLLEKHIRQSRACIVNEGVESRTNAVRMCRSVGHTGWCART